MKTRITAGAAALLLIQCILWGDDSNKASQVQKGDTTKKGPGQVKDATLPLASQINEKVTVNAVLIPPRDVRKIFGTAIADRFAVIQTTVTNPSSDYALIVHNISTDYSKWLLAGCFPENPNSSENKDDQNKNGNDTRITQAVTQPCQISSVELRAMRQVALQGQTDSARNRWVRGLKTLGTVGTGLTASAGLGPVLPKAVDAFTGSAIPAFEFLFPDDTINQINLLNDLAYAVNTVVPKDTSKVFMTFFPIDRFLGDFLGHYYRTSPALFYAPVQYYFDKKYDKFFIHVGERIKELPVLVAALDGVALDAAAIKAMNDDNKDPQKLIAYAAKKLSGLSLNSLRIVVDGKFIVETTDVAPTLTAINIADDQAKGFSTAKSTIPGALTGTLLSGANKILIDVTPPGNNPKPTITAAVVTEGSDDRNLKFALTLGDTPVLYSTKLSLTVSKPGKSGDLNSNSILYTVTNFGAESAPVLKPLDPLTVASGGTVTLKGSNFWNLSAVDRVAVKLTDKATQAEQQIQSYTISADGTQITFPIGNLAAATYYVTVSYKGLSSETLELTIKK